MRNTLGVDDEGVTLKILALSDIHGTRTGEEVLVSLISKHHPDIIVLAGDITHFGPISWATELMRNIDLPILFVNGNSDPREMITEIIRDEYLDADTHMSFRGVEFHGIVYPFDLFKKEEVHEKVAELALPKLETVEDIQGIEDINEKTIDILVTHVPPFGFNDKTEGKHVGDRDILEYIRMVKPRLVISGHVSDAIGTIEKKGRTYVNPGAAKDGHAALIDYGDKISVKLLSIK